MIADNIGKWDIKKKLFFDIQYPKLRPSDVVQYPILKTSDVFQYRFKPTAGLYMCTVNTVWQNCSLTMRRWRGTSANGDG
jgi:hypothetical protein